MTDIALETLLFSHILGVELDLQPSQVAVLAQIRGLCVDSPPLQYLDKAANFVFFGQPNVFEQRRTDGAEYVGLGKMETTSNSPHVGGLEAPMVCCVRYSLILTSGHSLEMSLLFGPVTASPWQQSAVPIARFVSVTPEYGATNSNVPGIDIRFSHVVQLFLRTDLPPAESHPDTCWLSALVSVAAHEYHQLLIFNQTMRPREGRRILFRPQKGLQNHSNRLISRLKSSEIWQQAEKSELMRSYLDGTDHTHLLQARFLYKTINSSRKQVIAFEKHNCASIPGYGNVEMILAHLRDQAEEAAEGIQELLEMQQQIKTMSASERAMEESRSAVACKHV